MQELKRTVVNMMDKDKYCVLLFDEMSLDASLSYDSKVDQIVGWEDYGDGHKNIAFADHAIVFMLRGIKRKWKQPIAFALLKDIIRSCDDIGPII
ncbi:Transposase protein [Popillia japonica]|uniref:Transposase protein n=1 Tax=Popillia japonica TaxID=7064 RepID=A0AAW1KI72_POPJA